MRRPEDTRSALWMRLSSHRGLSSARRGPAGRRRTANAGLVCAERAATGRPMLLAMTDTASAWLPLPSASSWQSFAHLAARTISLSDFARRIPRYVGSDFQASFAGAFEVDIGNYTSSLEADFSWAMANLDDREQAALLRKLFDLWESVLKDSATRRQRHGVLPQEGRELVEALRRDRVPVSDGGQLLWRPRREGKVLILGADIRPRHRDLVKCFFWDDLPAELPLGEYAVVLLDLDALVETADQQAIVDQPAFPARQTYGSSCAATGNS